MLAKQVVEASLSVVYLTGNSRKYLKRKLNVPRCAESIASHRIASPGDPCITFIARLSEAEFSVPGVVSKRICNRAPCLGILKADRQTEPGVLSVSPRYCIATLSRR